MKKYNFINTDGLIIETDKLSTIKKGLNLANLNHLKPIWRVKKEEQEFFLRYGLYMSVFNVGCLQELNMVYLFPNDYKRLKGGKKWNKYNNKNNYLK